MTGERVIAFERQIRIYIAGSSAELGRCERAHAYALSIGLPSTLDWTGSIRNALAAGLREHELPYEERSRLSRADLDAVLRAEALVLLAPEKGSQSRGCWVELGFAICLAMLHRGGYELPKKPIFVIRTPETAYESLFEVEGTQVLVNNDRHGFDLVRGLLHGAP